MPTYDFQCQECGEVFEVFRRFSKLDRKVQCPNCSSEKTKMIFSVPHIEGETVAGSGYGTRLPGSGPRTGGGRGMGRMANLDAIVAKLVEVSRLADEATPVTAKNLANQ